MKPKVSICIPVYNVEKYIGRCIESIQNQSLKDIEIVIVNDCTPDASIEIVRKYAACDNRIKIVNHDKNRGLMMTRRTGYMAATGDYITFCDSDDTLADGALEALYNSAVRENADIVSGTIEYVPVKGVRRLWKNQLSYGNDKISAFRSLLTGEFGHNLCSRLFHRELLQNNPYETFENATNGEDGMLFYQVVDKASKIIAINQVVYEYWQNLSSSSNVRFKENALRSIAIANTFRKKTAGKYDTLRDLTDKRIARSLWRFKAQGYDMGKYYHEVQLYGYDRYIELFRSLGFIGGVRIIIKMTINKLK